MVNEALSYYSDLAFQAVMAAYLVALVCYGIEFAAQRPVPPDRPRPGAARNGVRVAVAAGQRPGGGDRSTRVGSAGQHDTGVFGLVDRPAPPGWGRRFGRAATAVTVLGFTIQLASLITRGLAVGRVPWGNMYEFASMITVVAVGCWLLISVRSGLRAAGFFVMLPVTVLVFVAGTVLYTRAVALVPALQSYWLVIHVLAVSLSSGVLLVSGSASVMYLMGTRRRSLATVPAVTNGDDDAGGDVGDGGVVSSDAPRDGKRRLPSPAALDRVAYRTAIVAFPVYTFAVIAGAMWAESAWGRYWGWDPKETCAFITWMLYAGYLHARATAGWRGRRAAWIAVLGSVSILFNLFFINMVIAGLHSYAGLN